jgi:hypothetical protein
MRRSALLLTLSAALLAPSSTAAQSSDVPMVYTQYIKTDFSDMPAWIEYHQQHEVPVLEALVDEGILLSFGLWAHDTGGEHNLRYNYVVPNLNGVTRAGAAYITRVDSAAFRSAMSMIREMTDELWIIGDGTIPDGSSPAPFVYESIFQVEPAGIEQWNADFQKFGRPGLERAMDEGLISAWAKLDHAIGGPWNIKQIYWLTSWDARDEFSALMGRTAQELGATTGGTATVRGHTDVIWSPVPRLGN